MILLLLLFQVKGYATTAIDREIVKLEQEKAQLEVKQRELKDQFTETLGYIEEALLEIETAKDALDRDTDADALATLTAEEAALKAQRDQILLEKSNVDNRDLLQEISNLGQRISALRSSRNKIPQ